MDDVIIVDDVATWQRYFARLVQVAGKRARVYASEDFSLDVVSAWIREQALDSPDAALILDLTLRGLSGFRVAESLRDGDALPALILFVTADRPTAADDANAACISPTARVVWKDDVHLLTELISQS